MSRDAVLVKQVTEFLGPAVSDRLVMDADVEVGRVAAPDALVFRLERLRHPVPHFRSLAKACTDMLPVVAFVVRLRPDSLTLSGTDAVDKAFQLVGMENLWKDWAKHPIRLHTGVLQVA